MSLSHAIGRGSFSSAPVTSGDEAAEAEVALSLITNGVES